MVYEYIIHPKSHEKVPLSSEKGINIFSYTGGVLSSSHTKEDIDDSLTIFSEVLEDMQKSSLII